MYSVHMLDKEIIYIQDETKQNGARFYHTIQNGMQFKNYELFLEFSI